MGRYMRFSVTGMMMVHFGWQAIAAFMTSNIISGIFLVILTLCWVAAWRKKSIKWLFMQFVGN